MKQIWELIFTTLEESVGLAFDRIILPTVLSRSDNRTKDERRTTEHEGDKEQTPHELTRGETRLLTTHEPDHKKD